MAALTYPVEYTIDHLRQTRMGDPASVPAAAARGMLALAEAQARLRGNTRFVQTLWIPASPGFPGHERLTSTGTVTVMYNSLISRVGGPQPRHADTFGRFGHLRLSTIVLTYDNASGAATVGLVMPVRAYEQGVSRARLESGFTVLMAGAESWADAVTIIPDLPDPLLLLRLLRLVDGTVPPLRQLRHDTLDETVGLAGMEGFLSGELPLIEPYMTTAAALLGAHPTNRP